MKNVIRKNAFIAGIGLLSLATISSCTKTTKDAANKQYIGTYTGNDCAGNNNVTTVMTAGSSDDKINLSASIGSGSCNKSVSVVGTVNGNTIAFSTQTFTDNCGDSETLSGTGAMTGNTLTLSLAGTYTPSGSSTPIAITACFSGHK